MTPSIQTSLKHRGWTTSTTGPGEQNKHQFPCVGEQVTLQQLPRMGSMWQKRLRWMWWDSNIDLLFWSQWARQLHLYPYALPDRIWQRKSGLRVWLHVYLFPLPIITRLLCYDFRVYPVFILVDHAAPGLFVKPCSPSRHPRTLHWRRLGSLTPWETEWPLVGSSDKVFKKRNSPTLRKNFFICPPTRHCQTRSPSLTDGPGICAFHFQYR